MEWVPIIFEYLILRYAFEEVIAENGIGTISEIYDGNPPHESRGCISQSTSVAAVLYLKYVIDGLKK